MSTLQRKILVLQGGKLHFGGAGRGTAQRIVLEGAAVGGRRHHALFGTGDLFLGQGAAMGAVGASGLDLLLKQSGHKYTSTGMCTAIIAHIRALFHSFFSHI